MKKHFSYIAVAICSVSLFFCTSQAIMASETAQTEEAQKKESSASATKISDYEDIAKIYQFDLEGKHYSLPCTIDDFIQNSCTIGDRYLEETVPANHSLGQIKIHPGGNDEKYIEATVLNDTDKDMTVEECQKVIRITVYDDAQVSLVLNNGIKFAYDEDFFNKLKETYGTDEKIYREDDYGAQWHFYKNIENENSGQFVIFSSLQPGTDVMGLDNNSFYMEYIEPEQ